MRVNQLSWSIDRAATPNVRQVRTSFSRELRRLGKTGQQVEAGTIVLGELLANACEHGRLPIHVELRATGRRWQLSVRDAGSGFVHRALPFDPAAYRGRGLQIVERLGCAIYVSSGAHPNIEVTLPFGD